jgi:hypothetical protein
MEKRLARVMVRARSDSAEKNQQEIEHDSTIFCLTGDTVSPSQQHVGIGAERHAGDAGPDRVALAERL